MALERPYAKTKRKALFPLAASPGLWSRPYGSARLYWALFACAFEAPVA